MFPRSSKMDRWDTFLDMELNDTNKSFDNFFTVMNDLLDTCTPYKKLSLREIKLKKNHG